MNFTTFFNNYLIQERITGNTGWVYHRTGNSPEENPSLWKNGIDPTKNTSAAYGKGLYATYSLNAQLKNNMSNYGHYIVRGKVDLSNFFIFDEKVFKLARPRQSYSDQFKKYRIDFFDMNTYGDEEDEDGDPYTSDMAMKYWRTLMKKNVSGLVFNGRQDGNVVVIYDRHAFIPDSFSKDNGKTWNKITPDLKAIKRKDDSPIRIKDELDGKSALKIVKKLLTQNKVIPKRLKDILINDMLENEIYTLMDTVFDPESGTDRTHKEYEYKPSTSNNIAEKEIKSIFLEYIGSGDTWNTRYTARTVFGYLADHDITPWDELVPSIVKSGPSECLIVFKYYVKTDKMDDLSDTLIEKIASDSMVAAQAIQYMVRMNEALEANMPIPEKILASVASSPEESEETAEYCYRRDAVVPEPIAKSIAQSVRYSVKIIRYILMMQLEHDKFFDLYLDRISSTDPMPPEHSVAAPYWDICWFLIKCGREIPPKFYAPLFREQIAYVSKIMELVKLMEIHNVDVPQEFINFMNRSNITRLQDCNSRCSSGYKIYDDNGILNSKTVNELIAKKQAEENKDKLI